MCVCVFCVCASLCVCVCDWGGWVSVQCTWGIGVGWGVPMVRHGPLLLVAAVAGGLFWGGFSVSSGANAAVRR